MPARTLALTVLALFLPACGAEPPVRAAESDTAQETEPGFAVPEGFESEIEAYIEGWGQQWASFRVHGNTAVFAAGEPVYRGAWGMRDLAEQTPHAPDDAFEIGTLSIHLTHATTFALIQRGELSLDAPAADYVQLPLPREITIEHLLTMTSGLPNFAESLLFESLYKKRPGDAHAIVKSFATDPLEFEPGSDFAPSLSNAAVLGLVIEGVTKQDYAAAVEAEVLRPLKMEHTHFGRVPGASVGLSFDEAEHLVPVVDADPTSLVAAGGWTSNATDMGRLYGAMLGEHFGTTLSRGMWGMNDLERPYGFIPTTIGGREGYAWVGRFDGHEHAVVLVPEDDLVVLHLGNTAVPPGLDIAEAVAGLAYDLPVAAREEARPVPIDPEPLARYSGRWILRRSDVAMVEESADEETAAALRSVQTRFVEDEGLRLQIAGRPAKRMHPKAPRSFFFKDRPQSTAYIAGTTDAPMLVLERGGASLHYRWEGA